MPALPTIHPDGSTLLPLWNAPPTVSLAATETGAAGPSRVDPRKVRLATQQEVTPFFADNALGYVLDPITHPSGEYHDGVTYIAYQGPHEDPYVCSYNHTSQEWKGPYRAGVNIMGFYPDAKTGDLWDDHGRPTLTISADEHIHLFYGGHGGDPSFGTNRYGNYHQGRHTHVTSDNPLDISSWHEVAAVNTDPDVSASAYPTNVNVFGGYASSVTMDNGDTYVFVRHGAHESDWTYQLSRDGGNSFEGEVSVLKTKDTTKLACERPGPPCPNPNATTSLDSWYAHFVKGPKGSPKGHVIGCCFNWHLHESPGHGHFHYNGCGLLPCSSCTSSPLPSSGPARVWVFMQVLHGAGHARRKVEEHRGQGTGHARDEGARRRTCSGLQLRQYAPGH